MHLPLYHLLSPFINTAASEILTYEAISDGSFPAQCELVPFTDTIKTFVSSCNGLFTSKQINLIFESLISEDATSILYAYFDRKKMEQIIRNIISNACKFTPSGGKITVQLGHEEEISPRASHASATVAPMPDEIFKTGSHASATMAPMPDGVSKMGTLVIRITDTGVGIDPKNIQKLFGQFVQFDANDLQGIFVVFDSRHPTPYLSSTHTHKHTHTHSILLYISFPHSYTRTQHPIYPITSLCFILTQT